MSGFDELSNIRPRQVWDGMIARAIDGEHLTLAVFVLTDAIPSSTVGTSSFE